MSVSTTQKRILSSILGTTATASLLCAGYLGFGSPANHWIALVALAFVFAFVERQLEKLAENQLSELIRQCFVVCGILWVGPLGLLLCFVPIASKLLSENKNVRITLDQTFTYLISAFAAYLTLLSSKGFFEIYDGGKFESDGFGHERIVPVTVLMFVVQHLTASLISYAAQRTTSSRSALKTFKELTMPSFGATLIGLVIVLLLNAGVIEFGFSVGYMLLPMIIVSSFGIGIHLDSLEVKTRQLTESSRIHLATVEALATAIDARDQVGSGHVRRTQIYAVGMGQALGLSEDDINALGTGAMLHDVGKLAVPDYILKKQEKLSAAEIEKVKIHASVGASILERVNFPYPVATTVRYHHENFDGTGYPEGLSGHNIPLTARILAIAEEFDTLRGSRPNRPPYDKKTACAKLSENAGNRFDPNLVNVFLKNLETWEKEIDAEGLAYSLEPEYSGNNMPGQDLIKASGYIEKIQLANREDITLYELAKDFSGAVNLDHIISLFVRKIEEFVPFDTCIVYLLDDLGKTARVEYSKGKFESILNGRRVKLGDGIVGKVLEEKITMERSLVDEDISFEDIGFKTDFIGMAAFPLIADDHVIGAVSIYSEKFKTYEKEHIRIVNTISHIAAEAIQKTHMLKEAETFALTDLLTGLPNARSLQLQFEREVARSLRSGRGFQLLMLDLDGFKPVNDTFGHKAGDLMLKNIGNVINSELREYDFLARYGGDEFIALVSETSRADVNALMERIDQVVGDYKMQIDDKEARVGISIGSAGYPNAGGTLDELLIAADAAMYKLKQNKKRLPAEKITQEFNSEELLLELDHIITATPSIH